MTNVLGSSKSDEDSKKIESQFWAFFCHFCRFSLTKWMNSLNLTGSNETSESTRSHDKKINPNFIFFEDSRSSIVKMFC